MTSTGTADANGGWPRRRFRAKSRRRIDMAGAAAIVAIGSLGLWLLVASRPEAVSAVTEHQPPRVSVQRFELTRQPIKVTASGFVRSSENLVLSAELTARVTKTSPKLISGGRFEKGEIILLLDARTAKANLKQAESDLRGTQAELTFMALRVDRTERLTRRGASSQQTLDELKKEHSRLTAKAASLQASIERAKLDIERTVIRAPFDLVITSESVSEGDVVQPGKELARAVSTNAFELPVSLSTREIGLIRRHLKSNASTLEVSDLPATVRVDRSGGSISWSGYVHRVEPQIDTQTRSAIVVVRIRDPYATGRVDAIQRDKEGGDGSPPLLIGAFARAEIPVAPSRPYVSLPLRALRRGSSIWSVTADNRLQRVAIEIIYRTSETVMARIDDAAALTRVMVGDLAIATEGLEVRPHGAEGAAARQAASVSSGRDFETRAVEGHRP